MCQFFMLTALSTAIRIGVYTPADVHFGMIRDDCERGCSTPRGAELGMGGAYREV